MCKLRRPGYEQTIHVGRLVAELFGTETPANNDHPPANNGDDLANTDGQAIRLLYTGAAVIMTRQLPSAIRAGQQPAMVTNPIYAGRGPAIATASTLLRPISWPCAPTTFRTIAKIRKKTELLFNTATNQQSQQRSSEHGPTANARNVAAPFSHLTPKAADRGVGARRGASDQEKPR